MSFKFSSHIVSAEERLFRRIVLFLIKKREFVKILDIELFEQAIIEMSVYPNSELFDSLMKRQSEFIKNIEGILTNQIKY